MLVEEKAAHTCKVHSATQNSTSAKFTFLCLPTLLYKRPGRTLENISTGARNFTISLDCHPHLSVLERQVEGLRTLCTLTQPETNA